MPKTKKTHPQKTQAQNPAITRYPSPIATPAAKLTKEEKIDLIADRFHDIMEALGLDMEDESLAKTPKRVAKMYVNEIFSGLDPKNFPNIHLLDEQCTSEVGHHSLLMTKCGFTSFCEHHFVPMYGYAYVAYLPHSKLIGLSKIHRIVHFFAKRPQLQERLTSQIADSLSLILGHENVAVSIHAQHSCVMMRGVQDENGSTTTSYFSGEFKTDASKRDEFFRGIERLMKRSALPE